MMSRLFLLIAVSALAGAESLKDCRSVFLQRMPESLDEFIGVELHKWGALRVVAEQEKADCVARFGRVDSRTEVKSTGSALVPSSTSVETESVPQALPEASAGIAGTRKSAAISLVHRKSSEVVWADSKADGWSWSGGSRSLARKLVEQMRRDFSKLR